jgi:hypothetical protein
MKRKLLAALTLAVTCLTTTPAFAHDQSQHKGQATEGEIVSAQPGRFVMKTASGEKTVSFDDKTKIEVGDEAGKREDLEHGARVAVFGTKLPGGEIVAKEIVVLGGDSYYDAHRHEGGSRGAHEVGAQGAHE